MICPTFSSSDSAIALTGDPGGEMRGKNGGTFCGEPVRAGKVLFFNLNVRMTDRCHNVARFLNFALEVPHCSPQTWSIFEVDFGPLMLAPPCGRKSTILLRLRVRGRRCASNEPTTTFLGGPVGAQ
jgi:hypothetical protein